MNGIWAMKRDKGLGSGNICGQAEEDSGGG